MKGLVGVLLGAALAVIAVACGGAQKSMGVAPPVTATHSDAGALPGSLHDQIDELDRRITAQMASANLPHEAGVAPVPEPRAPTAPVRMVDPPRIDATCQHGRGEACTDACTLGDSICDNAKKICDLAAQLPGDPWAAQKCESGQQSCTTAKERCCTCS